MHELIGGSAEICVKSGHWTPIILDSPRKQPILLVSYHDFVTFARNLGELFKQLFRKPVAYTSSIP
jgi:hypothetical protein